MGKKKVIATTAIGIFLGFGLATGAHADYIDNRQTNQETRIQQGLDSGGLTTQEYNKLDAQQDRIEKKEEKFESDGIITNKEKFLLNKSLNNSSNAIYREKHDMQTVKDGSIVNIQPVQTKPMGINAREARQQGRIGQGIKSGELTRGEVKRLEKEQGRIRAEEARFKSDGQFTPRERAKVQHDLNHSNRHIYNTKHNGRSR